MRFFISIQYPLFPVSHTPSHGLAAALFKTAVKYPFCVIIVYSLYIRSMWLRSLIRALPFSCPWFSFLWFVTVDHWLPTRIFIHAPFSSAPSPAHLAAIPLMFDHEASVVRLDNCTDRAIQLTHDHPPPLMGEQLRKDSGHMLCMCVSSSSIFRGGVLTSHATLADSSS